MLHVINLCLLMVLRELFVTLKSKQEVGGKIQTEVPVQFGHHEHWWEQRHAVSLAAQCQVGTGAAAGEHEGCCEQCRDIGADYVQE